MNNSICECPCHRDDIDIVQHKAPCCVNVYAKYINKDGSIDYKRFNNLRFNTLHTFVSDILGVDNGKR